MGFKGTSVQLLKRLAGRKPWYWVKVIVIIAGGIYLGHWLDAEGHLIEARHKTYQLIQGLTPFPPYPEHTTLVLIKDEDYWRGEPAAREPIKRDYLAKIVAALDKYNAALIAVDFNLRSHVPDGSAAYEQKDYEAETEKLCEAVRNAARNRKVVLPKTIEVTWQNGNYFYEVRPDVLDGCDFQGGRVRFGYIALPHDTRQVPLMSLPVKNGPRLDSFSQAIVRATNEDALSRTPESADLPYGSFIETEEFEKRIVTAGDLLKGDTKARELVENRIVIMSGAWHTQGYEIGSLTDSYETPVGLIPGSLIHANYVEAMLDSRVFRTWDGWTLGVIEVLLSLGVAIPFALEIRALKKFAIVTLICLFVLALSYISVRNFGLVFDPFIPLILVTAHGVFEQIREWRADAHRYARERDRLPQPG